MIRYFGFHILFILFCLISVDSYSQIKCTNKLLAEIVEQLCVAPLDNEDSYEMMIPHVSKDKPIVFQRNKEGLIDHVGIKFFNREIIQKHPSFIYHFIERYFLELLLLPTQEDIQTKLKMERVSVSSEVYSMIDIKKGLSDIVSAVSDDFSIYVTCNNNRCSASCLKENKVIARIYFPLRYELITGYTKLEAENSFYSSFLLYQPHEFMPYAESDMSIYKDDIFCLNDDYYVAENIKSTSYFRQESDKFVPIFDSAQLDLSVCNLFNSGYDWNVQVEVEQNLYGGKKLSFNSSLARLTGYLKDNQCSLYTGIRKYDKKILQGVLMAVNMDLGYQHILMFSFNKELFDKPTEHKVHVKMFSFVPIHNVSSLF